MLGAIEALVSDPVPSVRFLVTIGLWRLSGKNHEFFWRLSKQISERETNQVVLDALCHTLSRVVAGQEEQTTTVLSSFAPRVLEKDEDSQLLGSLVSLVMGLALARKNAWAISISDGILERPVRFAKPLKRATSVVLASLRGGDVIRSKETNAIDGVVDWLAKAVDAVSGAIAELQRTSNSEWDDRRRSTFRDLYEVIDQTVAQLYFAADVDEAIRDKKKGAISEEERKALYIRVKPLLERIVLFALDEKNGVLFAPTAYHFMKLLAGVLAYDPVGVLHLASGVAVSSRPAGYNLDSLAIREVVSLVERILADYRSEVRTNEPLRDLVDLLDVFADTGWPEALKLVWRLDEIYR